MFAKVICSLFILLSHAVAHPAPDEPRSAPRQPTRFRLILESDPLLSQWKERTGLFVGRTDRGDCEPNPFPQSPGPAWWAKESNAYRVKVGRALSAQNDTLALIAWIADRPEPEVYVFAPSMERCLAGVAAFRGEAGVKLLRDGPVALHNAQSTAFVLQLTQKYGPGLIYSDETARQVVEGFDIDCKSPDRRVLPLRNVLLSVLKAADHSPTMWLSFRAERRGNTTRVYEIAHTAKGPQWEKVYLEINEWGELQVRAVRPEAMLNACFGSYGPLWTSTKR